MKRNALVFDLDGTLVDSVPDLEAALNETLREVGAPALPRAAVRFMVGDGTTALVARALAASGLPETLLAERLARFLALYEAAPVARSHAYPGVVETLAALRREGRRLAICTNKPQLATLAAMIGDNEHDVAAAHAAGIPIILVRYGYARVPLSTLPAEIQIDDFAALPDALRRLETLPDHGGAAATQLP